MLSPLPDPAPMPPGFGSREPPDRSHGLEAVMMIALLRLHHLMPPAPPSVWRRLWSGIAAHFRVRATEWFAAGELVLFGAALYSPLIPVFDVSPNMAVMATWMTEQTWGECFLGVAAVRLFALVVNGTFRRFRFSPHLRAFSSFVSIFLWSQVAWAMILSGVGATGMLTYSWFFCLETYNFICAIRDTGRAEGRRSGDGR